MPLCHKHNRFVLITERNNFSIKCVLHQRQEIILYAHGFINVNEVIIDSKQLPKYNKCALRCNRRISPALVLPRVATSDVILNHCAASRRIRVSGEMSLLLYPSYMTRRNGFDT